MAAELPRPGVEVVQEFQSASPTVVTPTLVPCVVAPYFEVIEVLSSDGTLNSDALLSDLYNQLDVTVPQSSFPSPRGNIDEVNVDSCDDNCQFVPNPSWRVVPCVAVNEEVSRSSNCWW